MDNGNGRKSWTEFFRIITPVFLILISGICGMVYARVTSIDERLFHHLTNADLHALRSAVVDKTEFEVYQRMRDRQMSDICGQLNKIENLILQHMAKDK